MSPVNLREQAPASARAGSASARRSRPESVSAQKKGLANRNLKRKLNNVKPRGEKARPPKSTPASATRTLATKAAKKDINKTSPPTRRPASGAAAVKKGAKTSLAKKMPLKSTVMDAKEHGGLFINEMRLSASASPVTSSTTTASSLRLSPSPLSSTAGGRSPRASAGVGLFPSSAFNTPLTQCSPNSEIIRRQSDLASRRTTTKSGGLFGWLWNLWS